MTLELLPLYGVSLACIGLLALLARHNKRTGWVKQRQTVVQDLLALQALWDETDGGASNVTVTSEPSVVPEAVPGTLSVTETANFTQQLGTLRHALVHPTVAPQAVDQPTSAECAT